MYESSFKCMFRKIISELHITQTEYIIFVCPKSRVTVIIVTVTSGKDGDRLLFLWLLPSNVPRLLRRTYLFLYSNSKNYFLKAIAPVCPDPIAKSVKFLYFNVRFKPKVKGAADHPPLPKSIWSSLLITPSPLISLYFKSPGRTVPNVCLACFSISASSWKKPSHT